MKLYRYILACFLFLQLTPLLSQIEKKSEQKRLAAAQFGRWLSPNEADNRVRGGTTSGPSVELDMTANQYFKKLQAEKATLPQKEKDRLAILAMSGPYRASFEFLETFALDGQYKLRRPYRSWGTEYIYILKNEENFISLQHIMVMYYKHEGKVHGPLVMKHWRQDWRYQAKRGFFYQPDGSFRVNDLKPQKGQWLQAVYQVDDSPRYSNIGRWQHRNGISTFEAEESWRPLPRRESSVRSDYQALLSANTFSIIAQGWLHEQNNLKAKSEPGQQIQFLAKEQGLNRYQRVKNFDFSTGDTYLKNTRLFWQVVQNYWSGVYQQGQFRLRKKVDGKFMFEPLFAYADKLNKGKAYDEEAAEKWVKQVLNGYVEY